MLNGDGTHPRRLTHNTVADEVPVWSPDGRRIAFIRRLERGIAVVVMNADGTGERVLARSPKSVSGSLAWSPRLTKGS